MHRACVELDVLKALISERLSRLTCSLWSVSPRSNRILSKLWATQFTSYFGQMSCIAQGTVIWIHLPFGNEDASSSFLFVKDKISLSFPQNLQAFPAAGPGPGQSCNIRNNKDLPALGVILEDKSHLAKCLWFILSSTSNIKILD